MLRESACLCEVPRVGKVAEEKVGERLPGLEGVGGQVGLFLMGAELQPGNDRKVLNLMVGSAAQPSEHTW